MRRKFPALIWADGETWEKHEWEQAQKLAVPITGPEIQTIDKLVRYCENARRRGRPDMVNGTSWDEEKRYQRLVHDLYQRAGAAAAHNNSQNVPLTLAEIRQIEQIRYKIQYFTNYYRTDRDPMLDLADDLLHRLHFLTWHAKATGALGGVTILPAQPEISP